MNEPKVGFFGTPPLRYIGGKWQLAEWIIRAFPPHRVYVEPYCGGAAVFFRKYRSGLEVLNDLDGDIVNFFHILRTRTDEIVKVIELTPYSRAEYQLALQPCDEPLERARRFYVALWQSFGSTLIYKSGWRHQKTDKQRTPVVDTWRRLDGLMMAADRLKDAQIESMPAIEVMKHYDSAETLFYVDPPYVLSSRGSGGGRRRYRYEMEDDDHRELAECLTKLKGMVILSGYSSPLYDTLYKGWKRLEKTSTTNGNNSSVEMLWLSPNTTAVDRLPMFNRGV